MKFTLTAKWRSQFNDDTNPNLSYLSLSCELTSERRGLGNGHGNYGCYFLKGTPSRPYRYSTTTTGN